VSSCLPSRLQIQLYRRLAGKLTSVKASAAELAYPPPMPKRVALWSARRSNAIRREASVNNEFAIFAGTVNPALACVVDRYPDGEVAVQLLDSVRGKEVFLVQPTSPPVNDHLVGLLALADACSRAVDRRRAATVSGQRLARQTVLKRLRRRPPQGG
jgi:hypothetical protein